MYKLKFLFYLLILSINDIKNKIVENCYEKYNIFNESMIVTVVQ